MNNFVAGISNSLRNTLDPEYVEAKNYLKDFGNKVGVVGVAALVAGIALLIIGIAMLPSAIAPLGIIVIALTLPCFYVAHNAFRLADNIEEVAKNPLKYSQNLSLKPRIMSQDLKNALGKDTYGAQWLIDGFVDGIDANLKQAYP